MADKTHISICICTFKRPEYLKNLLFILEHQKIDAILSYSIIVVDNDSNESARTIIENFKRNSKVDINYYVQPIQNISLARNLVISKSKGDYVALIDDDEFPDDNWLQQMHNAIKKYEADGVLGPVLPHFKNQPPKWVIKSNLFNRPRHNSGDILEWQNTRTGNAFINKRVFLDNGIWFLPKFGSGGEDRDFFKRKILEGKKFVWCNEAFVYEIVPPNRWNLKLLLKRALLRGKMAYYAANSKPKSVVFSILAVLIYTGCSPFFALQGKHILIKYLIKQFDHIGKIMAFLKIHPIREKYIQ